MSCFNPCSLGCFSRSRDRAGRVFHLDAVSILVLLDVFLEVWRTPGGVICLPWVSILVLLDVFLEARCYRGVGHRCIVFQSLFSWMFFSKLPSPAFLERTFCFNPCSLGCFSRSHRGACRQDSRYTVSILVLLDVFLEGPRMRGYPRGYRVSILVLLDVFLEEESYVGGFTFRRVSILVLLDVFLEVAISGVFGANFLFQSLFSWMFFSKRAGPSLYRYSR